VLRLPLISSSCTGRVASKFGGARLTALVCRAPRVKGTPIARPLISIPHGWTWMGSIQGPPWLRASMKTNRSAIYRCDGHHRATYVSMFNPGRPRSGAPSELA
jgi:hypothetical protein